MADYGLKGGGNSLRDALNEMYPLTGLGNIGANFPPAMFPPQTGSPQPSGPVPIPVPRPPMLPPMAPIPPGGSALAMQGLAPRGQFMPGQGGPLSWAARLGLTGAV